MLKVPSKCNTISQRVYLKIFKSVSPKVEPPTGALTKKIERTNLILKPAHIKAPSNHLN